MTLLIFLPLIVIAGGLSIRRWFVGSRQDIRSIESHRSSLDLLEHLAPDHGAAVGSVEPGSAHVRVVGSTGASVAAPVRPMAWGRVDGRPPAARPSWHQPREDPVPARIERARRRAAQASTDDAPRIVITDASVAAAPPDAQRAPRPRIEVGSVRGRVTRPEPEAPAVAATVLADDLDAASPHDVAAGAGRSRRPSRLRARAVLVSAASLVVVGGAGAAVAELHPFGHPTSHQASSSPVRTPRPKAVDANPVPTAPVPTPVNTAPPALTATSSTATDAIYTVTGGQLELSLSASGPCWVELRSGSPTGPVVYEGTIQPGTSQSFSAGGAAWLRMGDPAGVRLRINGSPVQLPSAANPYNVTVTAA